MLCACRQLERAVDDKSRAAAAAADPDGPADDTAGGRAASGRWKRLHRLEISAPHPPLLESLVRMVNSSLLWTERQLRACHGVALQGHRSRAWRWCCGGGLAGSARSWQQSRSCPRRWLRRTGYASASRSERFNTTKRAMWEMVNNGMLVPSRIARMRITARHPGAQAPTNQAW